MENNFGKYLKSLRKSKKITLTELAERVGLSQPYLSQLENGKRDNAKSPEFIKKIAEVLDEDYFDLMVKAGHITEEEAIKKRALNVLVKKGTEEMELVKFESMVEKSLKEQEKSYLEMINHFCKDFVEMHEKENPNAIGAAEKIAEYLQKIQDLKRTKETLSNIIEDQFTGFTLIEDTDL